MRSARSWLLLCALGPLGCASGGGGAPPAGPPQIGSPAPDFTLPGSDGKTYSLSQFRGVKPVVLAWFPKAFTGG